MDLGEFNVTLGRMTAFDIGAVAVALRRHHESPADDVDWWEATIAIERVLKASHRTRLAAAAANGASRAVQHAAIADGVALTQRRGHRRRARLRPRSPAASPPAPALRIPCGSSSPRGTSSSPPPPNTRVPAATARTRDESSTFL